MPRTPFARLFVVLFASVALHAARSSAQSIRVSEITRYDASDGLNTFPSQYTAGADGMLYGISDSSQTEFASIFRVDPIAKTHALAGTLDFGADHGGGGSSTTTSQLVLGPDEMLYGAFIVPSGYSAIFRFDPLTGSTEILKGFSPDPVTRAPGADGAYVTSVSIGSDGALYGVKLEAPDFSSSLFRFDPVSRVLTTTLAHLDFGFNATTVMTESSAGVWIGIYTDNDPGGFFTKVFRFDVNTRAITSLGLFGDGSVFPTAFAHTADGTVFGTATSFPASSIFRLDPNTAVMTTVATLPNQELIGGFVSAPDGFLYTETEEYSSGPTPQDIVRFDPATGKAIDLGTVLSGADSLFMNGIVVGTDGRLFGGTTNPYVAYSIAILDPLAVAPASGAFGGTTSLSATLNALGVPLAGKMIAFTLNGHAAGSATTNAQGAATVDNVSINGIAVGTDANIVGASFAGDGDFPATSGAGSLTVIAVAPPPPAATPGLMLGDGFIRDDDFRYEFAFVVREKANGNDRGGFALRVTNTDKPKSKKKPAPCNDTFVSTSYTNVVFSDDPTIRPGRARQPQVDTVQFAGPGVWNGQRGYRFEATAQDAGEPGRHRESLSVTVYDKTNHVVAQVSGELDGGNVQSIRIHH